MAEEANKETSLKLEENAPYAEFAQRLVMLRKGLKLTRPELASRIGISPRTLINYENGSRIPFADTAAKMAAVFGISVEELIGMENPGLEMEKAAALEKIREMYGGKGVAQAKAILEGTDSLLAGGTLTREQENDFIHEMQRLFILATEDARDRFTPNIFRTEERKLASRQRLKEAEHIAEELTEQIREREGTGVPYLDEDDF